MIETDFLSPHQLERDGCMKKEIKLGGLRMRHFPRFALLTIMLLGACSGIPGLAAPTPTLLPTNTPQPTFTPRPKDTSTPVPTETPNETATAAVKATQSADDILRELDEQLGNTNIPYKDGQLAWKHTFPLKISLSGLDRQILGIDRSLTAGNFILKSDVTWDAAGLLLCGAVFRSEQDLEKGKQYQFAFMRFSGLPAWEIAVYESGKYRSSPTKAKFSDAIDLGNGKTNQFLLVVQDDHFTLYMNGVRQGTYYDFAKQRSEGSIAFVGLLQSGRGTCEFENSWIWTLE